MNHISKKILAFIGFWVVCANLSAQTTNPSPKPIDSATLSKLISKQVKDTASGKSILKFSDTSVALIITHLETYTLMLNQVISTLRRGLDTADISENLPLDRAGQ